MKLATLRLDGSTAAAVIADSSATVVDGFADVGALLASGPGWRDTASAAAGRRIELDTLGPRDWAPVVPAPAKIICVGLNYRSHILEMGRELPSHPTLFTKYPEALVGPYDDIELPAASSAVDWEGELAVVIGSTVRHADAAQAEAAIAGYSIMNDVTMRDFQYRTTQWLQGKTFENSSPFGPWLATPEELADDAVLRTALDGETVQEIQVSDLLFGPVELVAYISGILTLRPGDVIATGTPGGVGHARDPKRYIAEGSRLTTSIDGLGTLDNLAIAERVTADAG